MSSISGAWTRPRPSAPALGVVSLALAIVIVVAGNYDVQPGENGGTGPAIVTGAICLALAAGLFGYVVPRARSVNRTTLILAVLALLSVVVFWSGITPVLAGAALAVSLRAETPPARAVFVVEALALLAAAAAVLFTLVDSHLF